MKQRRPLFGVRARGALWLLALGCRGSSPAIGSPGSSASSAARVELAQVTESARVAEPARVGKALPRAVQHGFRIEHGPLALELDPVDGGRIVELSLAGRSAVVPRSESARAYGSSFWPSPQSDWKWPPPPELDALPWQARIEGPAIVAESQENREYRLSASQRIEALSSGGFVIDYRIRNHASTARKVAGWQNTRVRPLGLTFFPSSAPAYPESAFPLAPLDGVMWFAHSGPDDARQGKLFADGDEGWLAHLDGDLLFVKVFPEVSRERQAPGEGEVEIYVDPAGEFVEVEQQGAYEEIAPGGELHWSCRWALERLELGQHLRPGDGALVERARALANRVR
jgi:hypothetical protein